MKQTLVMVALSMVSANANARSGGILGRSDAPGAGFCADCHTTGTGDAPTVALAGPTELAAGATGDFTFTVTRGSGTHSHAGLNVSAGDGVLSVVTANTIAATSHNGASSTGGRTEITHTEPHAYAGESVTFEFQWTAPAVAGSYVLYAAGNSVNRNFNNGGDDPSSTSHAVTVTSTCADADSDGFEDEACGGDDCNDADGSINPGATDTCGDAVDQDCDGSDAICCADADSDGFGDIACGGDDCDDTDAGVNPGATDVCGDAVDQDCSGSDAVCCADADGDGFDDAACGGDDCDDTDSAINPDATDVCADGIDQDCTGADQSCASNTPPSNDTDDGGCRSVPGGAAVGLFLLPLLWLRRRK